MTLGQAIHNKKNQEKQDILELPKDMDISNTILTWDAINTYPKLVEFVISKHADVFASIKSNQGLTFEDIKTAYAAYQNGARLYTKDGHNSTATGTVLSGGYFYNRRIVTLRAEDCMSKNVFQKWPHIRTVAIIETDRTNMVTNEVTHSIRYYITTLEMDLDKNPDFARDLLDISLKRWCVEVNHWHIDRFFGQDQAAYEKRRYKGACTTPILQRACEDIRFSALLLESFFADDAKRLTQDWLSIDLKFMKNDEEDRGYWPDPETYDHEPWPLQQFIEQHKKRKERKTAA